MYLKMDVNAEMHDTKSLTISPMTPQSPASNLNYANIRQTVEFKRNKKICKVLHKIGMFKPTKVADTLQGSIWRAYQIPQDLEKPTTSVIIKVTQQDLYRKSMANIEGQLFEVNEDVLLEQSIVKFLSQQPSCPNSIVKFHRFFKSHSSLFFVMEDGGCSLFEFVQRTHRLLNQGKIEVAHWHAVVRIIFEQMMEAIEYMHSLNICHFDISLENWLINDVAIDITKSEKLRFDVDDIQIKLCDFGLAQLFTKRKCLSNKFCGKPQYKSPEVIDEKKRFDAKKNDIWCLGMCLLLMQTCQYPWDVASKSDENFLYVSEHCICALFGEWDMLQLVDDKLFPILDGIFQPEIDRMSIAQIRKCIDEWK